MLLYLSSKSLSKTKTYYETIIGLLKWYDNDFIINSRRTRYNGYLVCEHDNSLYHYQKTEGNVLTNSTPFPMKPDTLWEILYKIDNNKI